MKGIINAKLPLINFPNQTSKSKVSKKPPPKPNKNLLPRKKRIILILIRNLNVKSPQETGEQTTNNEKSLRLTYLCKRHNKRIKDLCSFMCVYTGKSLIGIDTMGFMSCDLPSSL